MKKSLLASVAIAAVLPLAAQASVAVQQANERIEQPLTAATAATAAQHDRAGVDAANVLGHSAAMTQSELTLMARANHATMLPATDHHLDSPKQPSDW